MNSVLPSPPVASSATPSGVKRESCRFSFLHPDPYPPTRRARSPATSDGTVSRGAQPVLFRQTMGFPPLRCVGAGESTRTTRLRPVPVYLPSCRVSFPFYSRRLSVRHRHPFRLPHPALAAICALFHERARQHVHGKKLDGARPIPYVGMYVRSTHGALPSMSPRSAWL